MHNIPIKIKIITWKIFISKKLSPNFAKLCCSFTKYKTIKNCDFPKKLLLLSFIWLQLLINHHYTHFKHQLRFNMNLSFDNILLQLAMDYNKNIIYGGQETINHHQMYSSNYFDRNKCKDEEEQLDNSIRKIEDDVTLLLLLHNSRNRIYVDSNDKELPNKKAKYRKKAYYFTDANAGVRSVVTCRHEVWYKNYILHPLEDDDCWLKIFYNLFRLQY